MEIHWQASGNSYAHSSAPGGTGSPRPSAGGEGQQPGIRMAEAGFLDATIECVRCGQLVRQADMVSHAATCAVPGLPS